MTTEHSTQRRLPRWLRIALISAGSVFALIWIVWIVGVRLYATPERLDAQLNKKPERTRITIGSVSSWFPGRVTATGFRIINQTTKNQLEATVESVSARVAILPLLSKRVEVHGVKARGVVFKLRSRPTDAAEAAKKEPFVPPIEGLVYEPYAGPPKVPKEQKWAFAFEGAEVEDIRELWIEQYRLTGSGEAEADVIVGPAKMMSIPTATARFHDSTLTVAGKPTLTGVELNATTVFDELNTREEKGPDLMKKISGQVDLKVVTTEAAGMLNAFLGSPGWLEFVGSERTVTAKLFLDHGEIEPGCEIDVPGAPLTMVLSGLQIDGLPSVALKTVESSAGPETILDVTFGDYTLRDTGPSGLEAAGTGLNIHASGRAYLDGRPPEQVAVALDLGTARMPEIGALSGLFPEGMPVVLRDGSATLTGKFELPEATTVGEGWIHLVSNGLVVDSRGLQVAGDADLYLKVPACDFPARKLTIEDSRLSLRRFALSRQDKAQQASHEDWEGDITFPRGVLQLKDSFTLESDVSFKLSDTRPLVDFLSERKPMSGWSSRLLTKDDISGGAGLGLEQGTFRIKGFHADADPIMIKATLDIRGKNVRGKALAGYGVLRAGIEMQGGDRNLNLVGATKWYEKGAS